MARVTEKQLIAIVIIVIVLLLGGFGTGVFLLWQKNTTIKKKVVKLRSKRSDLDSMNIDVENKEKEVKGLATFIALAEEMIPIDETENEESFSKLYTGFVREAGVEFINQVPLGEVEIVEKKFKRFRYQARVEGKIDGIIKLFNEIERNKRFFKIDYFVISNKESEAPGVRPDPEKSCILTISTYTYYKPD